MIVAYRKHGQSVFVSKVGMVCMIDASDGFVVGKFRFSSKAISSLAISSGTAMGQ
jgi:U3 small nucleolar RNA-associated protein 5